MPTDTPPTSTFDQDGNPQSAISFRTETSRFQQIAICLANLLPGDEIETLSLGRVKILERDALGAKVELPSGRYRRLSNTALVHTLPASDDEIIIRGIASNGFIADRLRDFFDFVVGNSDVITKGNAQHWMPVGYVTPEVAARIKDLTGQEVTDGLHIVAGERLWHIHDDHGVPSIESPRGQIAIGRDQVARIPEVLAQPDIVTKAENGPSGEVRLEYRKRLSDGRYIYIEQVNLTHQILRTVTMRVHIEGVRTRAG